MRVSKPLTTNLADNRISQYKKVVIEAMSTFLFLLFLHSCEYHFGIESALVPTTTAATVDHGRIITLNQSHVEPTPHPPRRPNSRCKAIITYNDSTKLYSINDMPLIDIRKHKGKHRTIYRSNTPFHNRKEKEYAPYECVIKGYEGSWPSKEKCDHDSHLFEFSEELIFGTVLNFAKFVQLRSEFARRRRYLPTVEAEWKAVWKTSYTRQEMGEKEAKRFDKLPFNYEEKHIYRLFD